MTDAETMPPALSVVVPCYNEEAVLDTLEARLAAVCAAQFGDSYEILLVNDGSRDRTWNVICALAERNPRVVGLDLSRNHGHQLAVTAGLHLSRGDLVLIIDADLQDPPELLSRMVARIAEGYDVVYGKRTHRHGESAFKRGTASLFYKLLNRLADHEIPLDTGDFRLMTRRVVDQLNAMPEHFRFIRGMVSWIGFNQTAIEYERDPRLAGETHYPLYRMIRLALDAITSFSTLPLRIASHLGVFMGVVGFGLLVWALASWLADGTMAGWTSMIAVMLIMGSLQLIILGVFGDYLGRLYIENKRRPLFILREVRGQSRVPTPPDARATDAKPRAAAPLDLVK
ncbi:glycosyltransferase family 2 protein [Novosphingobium sp. H3SJ31-1]|uniref:Glycosyltransferase family 2 protein n=1 Tax=Novosphingobium album (ex Liu et al. 2023) TaxID=3031130 RepID=A0ABT5WNA1_9SPHN|nr:glycosyltransferase family 2 protein [Novosphingobium album (ex Liu et al. 2023)]